MTDVLVIGAGSTGCAAALSLKEADPSLEVVVVERDPSYEFAATGKGTGGVRQLFTRPENIQLSQVMLEAIDDWETWGSVGGAPAPALGWQENGYLFVVDESEQETLARNWETQQRHGVLGEYLEHRDLADRYPEIVTDDMAAGALSRRDGWLRPTVFFDVLRGKALHAGAQFLTGEVETVEQVGTEVTGVHLASGERLTAGAVIDAAGVQAPDLARQVGMDVPVEPMRRHEHYVETSEDLTHLPFFKDVHGLAVHSFRDGISVGLVDFDHPGGENFRIDPRDYPERVVPALAERFRGLGELTLRDSWTGLYDQNRFDGNMILGNAPGVADNFYLACGFSGHGFMHALGVGRALAELVLHGEYRSIDLTRMGYRRLLDREPYGEEGVR